MPTCTLTRISLLLTSSFTQLYPTPLWYVSLLSCIWNISQLMPEPDEQGNVPIHLQPGNYKKSFALYYAWYLEKQWFAPQSPMFHSMQGLCTSSYPVSLGMKEDDSVTMRTLCPYKMKPSTLNLKTKPSSSCQVIIFEFSPSNTVTCCVTAHHTGVTQLGSKCRIALMGLCGGG